MCDLAGEIASREAALTRFDAEADHERAQKRAALDDELGALRGRVSRFEKNAVRQRAELRRRLPVLQAASRALDEAQARPCPCPWAVPVGRARARARGLCP